MEFSVASAPGIFGYHRAALATVTAMPLPALETPSSSTLDGRVVATLSPPKLQIEEETIEALEAAGAATVTTGGTVAVVAALGVGVLVGATPETRQHVMNAL